MSFVNNIFGNVFEGILMPFRSLPPLVPIAILAFLTSIGMLWVFKRTSNQDKLALVKRRIQGSIFEIRLFNDSMRAILSAQMRILGQNLRYAGLSLVPAVWMIVPFVIIIAQLQSHYGWDGLEPDQPVLLKVHVDESAGSGEKPDIALSVPEGMRVETPAVWIPSLKELTWRIAGEQEGAYDVTFKAGDSTYNKTVFVATERGRRTPSRQQPNFVHQLLYPAEGPLPKSGPIHAVSIEYPNRTISVFGLHLHWLIVYFALSVVFAFMLKGRMGVTI